MNMVIPNEGKLLLLGWAIRDQAFSSAGYSVVLYQNNYTPVDATTWTYFTEATFTGYQPVNLLRSNFAPPIILTDVAYITSSITPIFNCTGGSPQTVYGWYMYEVGTSLIIAAQRFDTPRVMSSGTEEALNPFRIALKTFT